MITTIEAFIAKSNGLVNTHGLFESADTVNMYDYDLGSYSNEVKVDNYTFYEYPYEWVMCRTFVSQPGVNHLQVDLGQKIGELKSLSKKVGFDVGIMTLNKISIENYLQTDYEPSIYINKLSLLPKFKRVAIDTVILTHGCYNLLVYIKDNKLTHQLTINNVERFTIKPVRTNILYHKPFNHFLLNQWCGLITQRLMLHNDTHLSELSAKIIEVEKTVQIHRKFG